MIQGYNYHVYFKAGTAEKLTTVLTAGEHVLTLDNGKERFIKEVTALSKVFSLCKSTEEAEVNSQEIAFFQAVKARLAKFTTVNSGKTDEEIETAIRQIIDKAVVSEGVIDIFDAAGIKKPDISNKPYKFSSMKKKNKSVCDPKLPLHPLTLENFYRK